MSMITEVGIGLVILGMFIAGVCIGNAGANTTTERTAISHGAAYYICNPTNGETTLVWRNWK